MNHPPKVALGLFPGAIFYCNRQKIVKNSAEKWVNPPNATYVPKSVFMRVQLKMTKADKSAICFIRRYHISSVTRTVDAFG